MEEITGVIKGDIIVEEELQIGAVVAGTNS